MQGVQGADLLTGSEGRLKGLQAEQVHVSMGDGRVENKNLGDLGLTEALNQFWNSHCSDLSCVIECCYFLKPP